MGKRNIEQNIEDRLLVSVADSGICRVVASGDERSQFGEFKKADLKKLFCGDWQGDYREIFQVGNRECHRNGLFYYTKLVFWRNANVVVVVLNKAASADRVDKGVLAHAGVAHLSEAGAGVLRTFLAGC